MTRSLIFVLLSAAAFAQLPRHNEAGVAMGHLHLTSRDPGAQRAFWVEVMGGTPVKLANLETYRFPGVVVMVRKGEPSGGTKGSVVNHLGFKVPDVPAFVAKLKAAGASIVTAAEAPASKGEWWLNPGVKARQAFVMGPDEVKIEITEEPGLAVPIAHHHIHFFNASDVDTKKWYVDRFGAAPGRRGPFEAADVPGVNLTFSKDAAALAPTKGRSLDHIGFEVRDLEAFCKKLEGQGVKFDVAYRKVPALGIAIAFFTDPWGTYVELTEGLDKL
ncbi:MAG: VOC family protein [Bryobacteraceae bacterium]